MLATEAKLEDVATEVEVHQGAITITGGDDASIYVDFPENKPLARGETHAQLRVTADRFDVEIELNAVQLDALAGAIRAVQGELQNDGGAL